jgi:hypothetical protein
MTKREQVRLLGRQLEDVREHLTVMKSEIGQGEDRFEAVLSELAKLVEAWHTEDN